MNATASASVYATTSAFVSASESPANRVQQPPLLPFISDETLSLVSPIVLYWAYSLFFHVMSIIKIPFFERYRIHDPEEHVKNKVSVGEVVRGVLFQQVLQTIIGLLVVDDSTAVYIGDDVRAIASYVSLMWRVIKFTNLDKVLGAKFFLRLPALINAIAYLAYWYLLPICRVVLGMVILDTYQYFSHRAFHTNHFLYKHIHSHHHRLYVPYAFGALYNHPIEGLVMDTIGGAIAFFIPGMTSREGLFFFSFCTIKTVDDHCGYSLPWDPFQIVFYNNVAYHDIHHQPFGIKKNFSQPFFTLWDHYMDTYVATDITAATLKKKQARHAKRDEGQRKAESKRKLYEAEEKEREEATKKALVR